MTATLTDQGTEADGSRAALRTIRTRIPARLDRLSWSRFHWRVVIGLGAVWILDGLQVTIVGAVAARLTERGSGLHMSSASIGTAGAIYVAGACIGALVFGQLTDRFGRKKLFMLTLNMYLVATVATALSFAPWYFFLFRFLTGMGIGGEYAAINSAIDELIPARNRGRVDLAINGSYWVGSAIGGFAALAFLDTALFPKDVGWRLAFAIGAILGLGILLVRRTLPESPRWLFIHGHEDEAERIVDQIEAEVRRDTGVELPPPEGEITVRQRESIPFRELARVAIKRYPRRAFLGLALFIGQAFLYNAVVFDLGTLLHEFFAVGPASVPFYMAIFAMSNFLGPLLLGRFFDTIGRIPMISGTYLGSAAIVTALGVLLITSHLTTWAFMGLVLGAFFLASAGASSAYLTVSEVFPMETRALAIAFFFAVGTATGGIVGPVLFGQLIHSGSRHLVATGFFIGAGAMALGGIAELLFGVRAEQQSLENIAKPLTAEEAAELLPLPVTPERPPLPDAYSERHEAVRKREQAEDERTIAAEWRAAGLEDRDVEAAELRAQSLDELATAHEERALYALYARSASDVRIAREQSALAEEARGEAQRLRGPAADLASARAEMHESWSAVHVARAKALEARANHDDAQAAEDQREAKDRELIARAADQRVDAAEHRARAAALREEDAILSQAERQERIRARNLRSLDRARQGPNRFRPGPGGSLYSPGMLGTASTTSRLRASAREQLDHEIEAIARVLQERGPLERSELKRLVGARYWGPLRFRDALHAAVGEGRVKPRSRTVFEPPSPPALATTGPDGHGQPTDPGSGEPDPRRQRQEQEERQ